jgi:hypothetical protein
MILLTSTSDLVQVVTGGTQAIKVHASYVDINASNVVTPGRLNTAIASATTTSVVASPGSGVSRNLKFLSIANTDASASDAVTVQHTDGTTVIQLQKITLPAGYTMTYNADGGGWALLDKSGGVAISPLAGRFLAVTAVLTGTTTFTTGASTNTIRARLQASGGSGGGNPATAGSAGGGGSAGGYAEWTVAVTPNTAYTCAVGASVTGTSNAAGTVGNATTLTIGGTTCTANAGTAGAVGTTALVSAAGGAAPAVSTNGTVNASAQCGGNSVALTAADGSNVGGNGGGSDFGSGGLGGNAATGAAGGNAVGFGAGGGGSNAGSAATARAGGSSGAGILVVEEFS